MVRNQAVQNLPCPKCHCQWPPGAEYCICGTRLQKHSIVDFMRKQFQELGELGSVLSSLFIEE